METILSVTGMTCASCVHSIERHIGSMEGVQSIKVDLMTGQATVNHNKRVMTPEHVSTCVKDMGFDAQVLTSRAMVDVAIHNQIQTDAPPANGIQPVESWFNIEGMTCGACVATITSLLTKLAGVASVDVQLLTAQAAVRHYPCDIGVRDIANRISDAGFTAAPLNPNAGDEEKRALEPLAIALQNLQNHRRQLAKRFFVSLLFAIPMLVFSMIIEMALPETNPVAQAFHRRVFQQYTISVVIIFVIATVAQLTLGIYFYKHAYKSLVNTKTANMDVLIALGTTASYVGSVVSVALQKGSGEQFFETAVFLITFILLGRWLEAIAKGRTVSAVEALVNMQPEDALLVCGDKEDTLVTIDARQMQLGDHLQVNNGMRVPGDGVVVSGQTDIDESLLTGESMPVAKDVGSAVTGGTLNVTRTIRIRITAISEASTLSRIVKLVREAQSSKPHMQEVADRVASRFVPFVVLGALVVFVAWTAAGASGHIDRKWLLSKQGMGGMGENNNGDGMSSQQPMAYSIFALLNAISVLVIACPCALGLAAPTAIMVGTGLGARLGILIKGGGATMEAASKIDVVAFDKTGTLTLGNPAVVDSCEGAGDDEEQQMPDGFSGWLRACVLELEALSSHPLAAAICAHIRKTQREEESVPHKLLEHMEFPGRGMQATVEIPVGISQALGWSGNILKAKLLVGKNAWIMEEEGCMTRIYAETWTRWTASGFTSVIVALVPEKASGRGYALSAFALADQERPEARDVISGLKARGIDVWMISGDHPAAANTVASRLGITNVIAGVLPEQKSDTIRMLQHRGGGSGNKPVVMMVGDGINDMVAISQADVGVAISSGTAAVMESAPALLLRPSLYSLLTFLDLSCVVFRRIKLNFVWATIYNVVCIPIAAGILYPAIDRGLPPVVAGLLMVASSLTVMVSSLALKLYREPQQTG
ncbi:heavy metal translocatin [Coemansia reversa NRRL 1564]|uniref:P-type Cu(+) transporter n=1 Tax=Coemansia reversa (strain ATCC 12441 / NRRL 1564) TaxID=763665 RepID=A0A2G5B4U9_COERN|nr:heavy metal translocatin [Coemansia reversa NRRL 1564]|eukprot:PIA14029.1 heavy metal translocatin [Coemansia reversa NRRL 1564]